MDLKNGNGRAIKFTPERLDQIRNLIERGETREQIAALIGCTIGSLQVTCSRLGISLRRPREATGPRLPKAKPGPRPYAPSSDNGPPADTTEPSVRLEISYNGRSKTIVVPLTVSEFIALAHEAEINGITLAALVAAKIKR